MSEYRELQVVGPSGSQVAQATVATEPPWSIRLVLASGLVSEAVDVDLFSALEAVRRQLEAEGLMLCCQGARPDVLPSGMARQMGGGRRAYRLRRDRRPDRTDLVDVFAPANCDDVVTVDEQHAAVQGFYDAG
jgi:hypothetical protein